PSGYWTFLNFPKRDYVADRGESQYRRGMYTFWQRTFPHPSLIAFDAPSREVCTADRPRAHTAQQALVLLNGTTCSEPARAHAATVLRDGGSRDEDRLAFAYRQVLGRTPRKAEVDLLLPLLNRHLEQYRGDQSAVGGLLNVGLAPLDKA